MKKTAFVLALLVLPAMAFAGSATLSLKQNTTNATSVTFGPTGGQFVVDVWLNTTAADAPEGVANLVANLCLYKADRVTPISGAVSVVTRTASHSAGYGPFDTSDLWDIALGTAIAGDLNPYSKSLGVGATAGLGTQTPKKYYAVPTAAYGIEDPDTGDVTNYSFTIPWKLMKITLNLTGMPTGSCYLGFTPGSYVGTTTDNGLYPAAMDTTLEGIIIAPEPATMLLLAAAVPFLRRRPA